MSGEVKWKPRPVGWFDAPHEYHGADYAKLFPWFRDDSIPYEEKKKLFGSQAVGIAWTKGHAHLKSNVTPSKGFHKDITCRDCGAFAQFTVSEFFTITNEPDRIVGNLLNVACTKKKKK